MNQERFGQLINFAPEDSIVGNRSSSAENCGSVDVNNLAKTRIGQYRKISEAFGQEGESGSDTLRRLFVAEGCSVSEVGKIAHLGRKTLYSILNELEIPRKTKGSSEYELWRLDKVREFWQDPVNREKTIAKMHTIESDTLRSKSLKKYYEQNPDAVLRQAESFRTTRAAKRASLCKELFGSENLKGVLELQILAGLGRQQIAEKFGTHPDTISKWIKDLEIGAKPKRSVRKQRNDENERRKILASKAKENGSFQRLSDRQKQVLDLLYGENNVWPTMKDVGAKIGVSSQRIDQLSQIAFLNLNRMASGEIIRRGRMMSKLPLEKMGENPSETLVSWYQDEELSARDIGNRLGITEILVWKLLREISVKMRKRGARKGVRIENYNQMLFTEPPEEIAKTDVNELNFGLANSIMLRHDLMSLSVGELSAMTDDELMSLKGVGRGKVNSIRFAIAKFV